MNEQHGFPLTSLDLNNPWCLHESGQLSEKMIDRLGNKFLVGNGFIGYRGTLEEYDKRQKTATIISGLYDKVGQAWREPINLPNGGFVQVYHKGKLLHAAESKVLAHTQQLDMKHALHERETFFETPNATQICLRTQRFASLAEPALLCMAIQITANRDCSISLRSGIDGDVWDLNGPHLENYTIHEADNLLILGATTHENKIPVAVAEYCVTGYKTTACIVEEKNILREYEIQLTANQPALLYKIIAHVSGLESKNPLADSQRICMQAADRGYDQLLAEHKQHWQQRWDTCDIQISGDPQAQQALRFSQYHLLSIAPIHTDTVSIPGRGLSGQVYKGGIFWDTEIFMLPFFLHHFPQIARNLLMYRVHTLAGARRKAAEYGFRGAFYAWESQDSGDDACTLFNVTDVFTNRPMRTYFRDKQIHISADIAYAFWNYYQISGDAGIWQDGGAEVVLECARFFLAYSYYNPDKKRYEILDVTGPDEYHERVHNNAFSNWMAGHCLQICLNVAELLKLQNTALYQILFGPPEIQQDLERMRSMVEQLYCPGADTDGEIIPQFDGYLDLDNVSPQSLLARKLDPHEYLGGGNGLATTTQILKQADVILALFLFPDAFSEQTKRVNWEYYEPRTEHGSSLSACSYSIIAAQIGKIDWAYRYFLKTACIDINGEGKQYVGPLYIGGTHPAANGGAWMSAVFGLCGIQVTSENLIINPHLPDHWQSVELPLLVQGQSLKIKINFEQIEIQALKPVTHPINILIGKQKFLLDAGITSIDCIYYR